MEFFEGVGCMAAAWLMVALVGHGYANTVDRVALMLHRHALATRARHGVRTKVVQGMWTGRAGKHIVTLEQPEGTGSKFWAWSKNRKREKVG